MATSAEAAEGQAWHTIVCDTLKRNSVPLVVYVPDNVLRPLIKAVHEDSFFTAFVGDPRGGSGRHRGRRLLWRACTASC